MKKLFAVHTNLYSLICDLLFLGGFLVLFYEVDWMGPSTVYERHVLGNLSDLAGHPDHPLQHIHSAGKEDYRSLLFNLILRKTEIERS
jgi:hypothetical protein